jgi:hypothetical protein
LLNDACCQCLCLVYAYDCLSSAISARAQSCPPKLYLRLSRIVPVAPPHSAHARLGAPFCPGPSRTPPPGTCHSACPTPPSLATKTSRERHIQSPATARRCCLRTKPCPAPAIATVKVVSLFSQPPQYGTTRLSTIQCQPGCRESKPGLADSSAWLRLCKYRAGASTTLLSFVSLRIPGRAKVIWKAFFCARCLHLQQLSFWRLQ